VPVGTLRGTTFAVCGPPWKQLVRKRMMRKTRRKIKGGEGQMRVRRLVQYK
jgi:hypothetical protein